MAGLIKIGSPGQFANSLYMTSSANPPCTDRSAYDTTGCPKPPPRPRPSTMLGIYILIGIVVAIAAGFLAYRTWRFFKRRANRRGADVEEGPAGKFHQLGSQPQDLHQLSGSENNEPSLEAQPQRLQPQPLLAKPPPCRRLPFGSENELSLSAQPQQTLALKHPSQPKTKCRLAMRVSNEKSYRSVRKLCEEGVVYDGYGDTAFELYFNSVPVCGVKLDGVMAQPEWQATYWDNDPLKELGFEPLTLNSDRFEWRDFHSKKKKKKKETPQRHFNIIN